MSFKYGFYNSVDHDRVYDATDMSSIFDGIIKDGVFASIGHGMLVSAGPGLGVTVGTGKAWFDHTWNWLTAELPLSVDAADAAYNRIDAVVIEVNATNRTNAIKVITGTPSSSAAKPELLPYQYPLAYVTVRKNATSISAGDLEITVGTAECPLVTGILETIDLTPIIEQYKSKWNDDFYEWFSHLQNELDSNQAANLQNQIDKKDGFHIGDLLATKATDLDDSWVYCNGAYCYGKEYPDAGKVLNVENRELQLGSLYGVTEDRVDMSRIVNGHLVTILREGYTNSKRPYIWTVTNTDTPAVVAAQYNAKNAYDAAANDVPVFISYNSSIKKYVYINSADSGRSGSNGAIYTSDEINPGNATRIAYLPFASAPIKDFIWWGGCYWLVISNALYRSTDPAATDAWTLVRNLYEDSTLETILGNPSFSIIDGALYLLYGVGKRSKPAQQEQAWVWRMGRFASAIDSGVWSEVSVATSASAERPLRKYITKIGSGLYVNMDESFSHGNPQTSMLQKITVTNGALAGIANIAFATGTSGTIFAIGESDEHYYIFVNAQYTHTLYKQAKVGDDPSFGSVQEWEYIFQYVGTSHASWCFGPLFAADESNIFMLENRRSATSSATNPYFNTLVAYQPDVFQVPSVADTAAGFRHYIKVGTSKGI